jgi:hypothetical protein
MREPLPLATIHDAVLEFLRGRDDAVVFGATAVNAYVSEPRMTQDIYIMSTRGVEFAEELRDFLSERFHIAVRVRTVREGLGYRIYQMQKTGNRHLVDVRPVQSLPTSLVVEGVQVLTPVELVAYKVLSYSARRGKPKAGTDWRDLAMLLLQFPELKTDAGPVRDQLLTLGAKAEALACWHQLLAEEITPESDEEEFA